MVNTIDYSELKKASEVLERQQVTPHPHPSNSTGKSQPVSGARAACLSLRELLGPSRSVPSTTSRDIGAGLSAEACL